MKTHRALEFRYYDEAKARELEKVLDENGFDYVSYYCGLYILFRVKKNKGTWEELYQLINSVNAPKYKYINTYIENGKEHVFITL